MGALTDFFAPDATVSGQATAKSAPQDDVVADLQTLLGQHQSVLKDLKVGSETYQRTQNNIAEIQRELAKRNVSTPEAASSSLSSFFTEPVSQQAEAKINNPPSFLQGLIQSTVSERQAAQAGAVKTGQEFLKPLQGMSFEDFKKNSFLAPAATLAAGAVNPNIPLSEMDAARQQLNAKFSNAFQGFKQAITHPIETIQAIGENPGRSAGEALKSTIYDPEMLLAPEVGGVAGNLAKRGYQAVERLAVPQAARTAAAATKAAKPAFGPASIGAAEAMPADVKAANINAAIADASPELQAHVASLGNDKVNLPALETRALEEKHGIDLVTGQRLNDPALYAEQWNKRGETSTLQQHFDNQPKQFSEAFDKAKEKHAPDIPSTADASELGQHEINALASTDAARQAKISAAYKALEDANGGQFPIDVGALNENITNRLSKEYKSNYLPEAVSSDLKQFAANPTFEGFEALRTNLANEMRSNANGNIRQAAYIVRDELEKMPVFGEAEAGGNPQAAHLKQLADNARSLYKERQDILKSNPAYKAATKEFATAEDASAQGESLNAEKFHNKYVANATPEAIRRMKSEIAPDDIAHQAIVFGELERAKNAALNATRSDLKPASFANFLQKNKSGLREALTPEAMQDVTELGLLSSKVGMPKSGTFNYSNTFSSQLGQLAKEGLLTAAEANLALHTAGKSLPITKAGRMYFQGLRKEAYAKEATNPFGGISSEVKTAEKAPAPAPKQVNLKDIQP